MNTAWVYRSIISMAFIGFYTIMHCAGQTNRSDDSLSLDYILNEVIQHHPTVKQAEELQSLGEAKIGMANSGYYPDVNISGSYSRIGPVPELTFPGLGTFKFYPENNWNTAINYHQIIWDFGKTKTAVATENANMEIARQSIEQTIQKMSLTAIGNYYSVLFLQEAITIYNQQIAVLNEHLLYLNKKKETGSATEYEILSLRVKISSLESQLLDAENQLSVQLSVLNSLLGETENQRHTVKRNLSVNLPAISNDSICSVAINNNEELMILTRQTVINDLKLKMIQAQKYPLLEGMATYGFKNGYIPDIDKLQQNYVVGVGLKIPIINGNRTRFGLAMANSNRRAGDFETEATKRRIINEVTENEANIKTSLKKIEKYNIQLMLAEKAYDLALVNYKAGVITLLDVLDASTSVEDSRLSLLKSKIDYVLNVYKLKKVMGLKLY